MNISERSTEYKGYIIVAEQAVSEHSQYGEKGQWEECGWAVPDVIVEPIMQPEKRRALKASEWLENPSFLVKNEKDAIQESFKYARNAIDNGFVRDK